MGIHHDSTTCQDECQWNGVTCDESDQVKEILWANIANGKVDIRWLPKSLDLLDWERLLPYSPTLQTRLLPPYLRGCRVTACGYTGHLNLETLPEKLVILDVRKNAFCGTVRLTNLPSTLERLQLERNSIDKVIVSNKRLPVKFWSASLFGNSENLRIVCLDSNRPDERILKTKRYYKCGGT
eukprot:CAMPEP_0201510942 /NCGR_PEP_ID=MMETSP0161_2-20130828/3464_1 /ASSEMBLY_ACC=CAM_ASM_000251 /TAXON_ID=180227 /ORGANISM="Neoparamoeba aestuarina, Strain SoJaBio B1-5/56/2" /LENGTH=181 /DNA_ID=CAMNT_0047906225 /DNA_START=144 /DNA_END=689 /DNA_ORIENTATION=+